MLRFLFISALLLLLTAGHTSLRAQPVTARTTQVALTAEAQAHLAGADTTLRFRTRPVPGGRIDEDTGLFRAAYRLDVPVSPPATPEIAARAALRTTARAFGWAEAADDLVLNTIQRQPNSSHLHYRQTFAGLPVHNRHVTVNLDAQGRPTMILSAYDARLTAAEEKAFNPRPTLTAEDAQARTRQLVEDGAVETGTAELVVFPTDPPRLAWHLVAWPKNAPAEWSVRIDAHNGDLLQLVDQGVRGHKGNTPTNQAPIPTMRPPEAGLAPAFVSATGKGFVFDPDPLTSSGNPYVAPFVDTDDQDVQELNAERLLVDLLDITQGNDGLYRLEGPYIQIVGEDNSGTKVYDPPMEATADGFQYTRAQEGFEAVNAYYHIDKSQRYVQSLGITDRQNGPLKVNPQGLTRDDSFYFPSRNLIIFGTGGIDDAEDATVLWHEYAHALLEAGAPSLLSTPEGSALHEGWADYWAASYARELFDQGLSKRSDWERLFRWDSGDGKVWAGRVMDHAGHYPEDICSDDPNPGTCSPHNDGRLWATTLLEIYSDLGRTVTDRLNLLSHAYLSAPVTFRDAAEAIVQADIDNYSGEHVGVLLNHFGARGLVDPGAYGPIVLHTPLASTEQLGGTRLLEVQASGTSAAVDSVVVYFGMTLPATQEQLLAASGNDRFLTDLPLPDQAGTVYYYLEAVDKLGRRTLMPSGAPGQTYQFSFGPDTEAPVITHEPLTAVALAIWPVEVEAQVTDNLGVDSVWVDYTIYSPDGTPGEAGTFNLTPGPNTYNAFFPVPVSVFRKDSTVRYRIHARDKAAAGNERILPETGTFDFIIVVEGLLLSYNFETLNQQVQAGGAWARGAPSFGLRVAHSGGNTWGTTPNGTYPDTEGVSSLELPALNLEGLNSVYLTFWHWYDLEHSGGVEPGQQNGALLYDGANVKVSTDGGNTWTVAVPQGGYTGTIDDGRNPLGGEPGFGGYSYGWRRETIQLPASADVRIRFDLGTDDSNNQHALFFDGWYLDDLNVTTSLPEDTTPPSALTHPPASLLRNVGQSIPLISLNLTDDTGIADAFVTYEVNTGQSTEVGLTRLAMSLTDLHTFEGAINSFNVPAAGNRITYRLRFTDFDGHEVTLPPPGEAPYLIEYRLIQNADVLQDVQPSGNWQMTGTSWSATGSDHTNAARSSLVFEPLDLPANPAELHLTLEHRYSFDADFGGNLKLSLDDGRTWAVLAPTDGYTGLYTPDASHPMSGEAVFSGNSSGFQTTAFDLLPYAGRQVRLRLDLGAPETSQADNFWTIQQAAFVLSTRESAFETPRVLTLHANYPDPFSTSTTINYTLPEPLPVTMELFDILGRRVTVLIGGDEQEAGTYTLVFNAGSLASGVYLLRFIAGATQKVERMVIAR